MKIVVSVRWDGGFRHVMLKRVEDGWEMPDGVYPTVYDLIDSYINNKTVLSQPGNVTLIGKGIQRAKWLIPKRDIRKTKKLGEGAFGKVYEGSLRIRDKNREIPVAIKTCKELMSDKQRDQFMKEAKLMLNYIHRNVARLYGVVADKPPLMLVMELCPEGGLDGYLEKREGKLSVETKIRFCAEAARGMEYLAVKKDLIHRDLATRNCLVGVRGEVKVSDFGLSKRGDYKIADRTKASLPIRWSAPESLTTGSFTKASDVFSFGILMWEIFAETTQPWGHLTNKEAYKAIKDRQKLEMPKGKKVHSLFLLISASFYFLKMTVSGPERNGTLDETVLERSKRTTGHDSNQTRTG